MTDTFRWPATPADLRDGLTPRDVIEALHAPTSLRLENRAPGQGPTLLVTCAPTDEQRMIVVVCTRNEADQPWTIVGARDASINERAMWRKYTS